MKTREIRIQSKTSTLVVGRDLLVQLPSMIDAADGSRLCLCVDDAIAHTHGQLVADAFGDKANLAVARVGADETLKTASTVERLWDELRRAGVDRTGVVIGMGGGIVGDVAGFAAASWMRGVDLVLVPTTLLAMVDASIGGKTGINVPLDDDSLGKNLAGAFWPARLIVADIGVLDSLDQRDFRCGLAEAMKHAIIDSPEAFETLQKDLPALLARDHDTVEALVIRSSAIKASIVERDPLEHGDRALLNLGHTFAHAFEARHELGLLHGEAVSIGLIAAAAAAVSMGLAKPSLREQIQAALAEAGLPISLPTTVERSLFKAAMGLDKKRRAGRSRLVLPRALGDVVVVDSPPESVIDAGLAAVEV